MNALCSLPAIVKARPVPATSRMARFRARRRDICCAALSHYETGLARFEAMTAYARACAVAAGPVRRRLDEEA
jgi:hypothetical protein